MGLQRSEEELTSLCKQTVQGTSPVNLRRAILAVGGMGTVIQTADSAVGVLYVLQALYEGRPVIVCVDKWEHWAVAAGTLGFGKRIVCIDSGDNDLVVMRTVDDFSTLIALAEQVRYRTLPLVRKASGS
jgi:hypothetical protein